MGLVSTKGTPGNRARGIIRGCESQGATNNHPQEGDQNNAIVDTIFRRGSGLVQTMLIDKLKNKTRGQHFSFKTKKVDFLRTDISLYLTYMNIGI